MHVVSSLCFKYRFFPGLSFLVVSAFLFSCQTPLDPPGNVANSPGPMEFESVWQYCKAWSIYQDSSIYAGVIPANPFAFSNPEYIMAAINDTLSGAGDPYDYTFNFTGYDYADGMDTFFNSAAASISPVSGVASVGSSPTMPYDSNVTLDSITDSTGLLTIYTFEAGTDGQVYNDFQYCLPGLQGFKNIIVDLRPNGGGYIDEAVNIIQSMVPLGTHFIQLRERGFSAASKSYATFDWHDSVTVRTPLLSGKHYAVIIDDSTASAAELTTAALYEGQKKEWQSTGDSAWILGSRSFGKGIGQVVIERRRSCYESFTGIDTLYNNNYDTMETVPFTANYFLDLKITCMQIKGVSPRIGLYHRVGIATDIVPASVKQQVDALPFDVADTGFWRPIFYGLKLMEPGVNMSAVISDSGVPAKRVASTLPGRFPKKRRGVGQVVERVIQTSTLLPLK
jgi:hypothetical protein